MNLVFAGTPDFAVVHLRALLDADLPVRAVYTQPDRPAGRGRRLRPSPVKELALTQGIAVYQPETLRDAAAQTVLSELQPDLMVVVAYGLLLPTPVLTTPRFGCINSHASLLPRWRGASPIQRAIWAGDTETGISVMQMDEGLDTGPVLCVARCSIEPGDTAGRLHDRLAALGARTLVETLEDFDGLRLRAVAQNDGAATYARKVDKAEARLDWSRPAAELERWVRAFNPWPVAWTRCGTVQWRVWEAETWDSGPAGDPGRVVAASPAGIDVCTAEGLLRIRRLQLSGARPVSASDYLNGHRSPVGETLLD